MRPSKSTLQAIRDAQGALPFRGQQQGLLSYALPWERRLALALSALCLVFVVLYIYFVMASIVHVAARQELAGKVATTKAAVSQLETKYLTKTASITEVYAKSVGFVSAPKQVFVERASAVTLRDAQ